MSESLLQKVQNEARAFLYAPIYPFLQKDWPAKLWIFVVLSYVPVLNVIIARGWRMDYVRRLGWQEEKVLPSPRDMLTFFLNGLLLWLATGVFLLVPLVPITLFGLGGWLDLWNDLMSVLGLLGGYFLLGALSTGEFLSQLWSLIVNELIATFLVFMIENIWLILYVPIYRVATIRFALTGKLLQSHMAVRRNFSFLRRNFVDILLMYAFNIFNFALFIVVATLLSITVVGVPLIPIVTFFMPYWNSGYEYGLLARMMVEQEGLVPVTAPVAAPAPVVAEPQLALAPAAAQTPLAPAATMAAISGAPLATDLTAASLAPAVPSPTRFCMACGAQLAPAYRFCTGCGAATEPGEAAA